MELQLDVTSDAKVPFFKRHEFAIRRIHSLLGIVPLGAYMVVHLVTNASLLDGPGTFQRAVIQIHSLGRALPAVEWTFIFFPLLFHAIIGIWIARTGRVNSGQYTFATNRRYSWQRWTGFIAFAFLMVHVFHLHGWLHFEAWLKYFAEPLGGAKFRPYNAASTLARALDGVAWPAFYAAGVLACIYHLANGLWTAGITWGIWTSVKAQERASKVCTAFGLFLTLIGGIAWYAAVTTDPQKAKVIEDRMYNAGVAAETIRANEHKRTSEDSANE